MIDFDKVQKLKSERDDARRDYELAIRDLNDAMIEFNHAQNNTEGNHSDFPNDNMVYTSYAADGFLNLVEMTKEYYDCKANYEKLNAEYQRQDRILDLVEDISRYIDWINRSTPNDYTPKLESAFNELFKLIR